MDNDSLPYSSNFEDILRVAMSVAGFRNERILKAHDLLIGLLCLPRDTDPALSKVWSDIKYSEEDINKLLSAHRPLQTPSFDEFSRFDFSHAARELLDRAQRLAQEHGYTEVEPIHMLNAMTWADENKSTGRDLAKICPLEDIRMTTAYRSKEFSPRTAVEAQVPAIIGKTTIQVEVPIDEARMFLRLHSDDSTLAAVPLLVTIRKELERALPATSP